MVGSWFKIIRSTPIHHGNVPPKYYPGPAATSPGNVLEMQILGLHPVSTESKTPGVWSSDLCCNGPSREFRWQPI